MTTQTAEATHSPLPWVLQDLGERPGYPNWHAFTIRCEKTNVHIATVGNIDRYYEGREHANATLIVQAVNCHGELVEACKAVADDFESAGCDGCGTISNEALAKITAALKKAGAL